MRDEYPDPEKPKENPFLKPWIIIILAVIILGEGGYLGWYYLKGPGAKPKTVSVASTSSPDSSSLDSSFLDVSPSASPTSSPSPSSSVSPSPSVSPSVSPSPLKSASPSPSPTISAPSGTQKLEYTSCWTNDIAFKYPSKNYVVNNSKADTVSFEIDHVLAGVKDSYIQILGPGVVGDCNKYLTIDATYNAYLTTLGANYTIIDGPTASTVNGAESMSFTYKNTVNKVDGSHTYQSENTLIRFSDKYYAVIRTETNLSGSTPTLKFDAGYADFIDTFSFDY